MEEDDGQEDGLRALGRKPPLRREPAGGTAAVVYNRIHGAFQTFRSEASRKDAAIREILPQKPAFTYEQLEEYLGPIIRWDLTDEYLDGLRTFYKLAHEMNLIDHVPEIEFAAVQRS